MNSKHLSIASLGVIMLAVAHSSISCQITYFNGTQLNIEDSSMCHERLNDDICKLFRDQVVKFEANMNVRTVKLQLLSAEGNNVKYTSQDHMLKGTQNAHRVDIVIVEKCAMQNE